MLVRHMPWTHTSPGGHTLSPFSEPHRLAPKTGEHSPVHPVLSTSSGSSPASRKSSAACASFAGASGNRALRRIRPSRPGRLALAARQPGSPPTTREAASAVPVACQGSSNAVEVHCSAP